MVIGKLLTMNLRIDNRMHMLDFQTNRNMHGELEYECDEWLGGSAQYANGEQHEREAAVARRVALRRRGARAAAAEQRVLRFVLDDAAGGGVGAFGCERVLLESPVDACVAAQVVDDDGVGESDEEEGDAGEQDDIEPRHERAREVHEALDGDAHEVRARVVAVLGLQLVRERQVRVERAEHDEQHDEHAARDAQRAQLLGAERQRDPHQAVDRHRHDHPRRVLHRWENRGSILERGRLATLKGACGTHAIQQLSLSLSVSRLTVGRMACGPLIAQERVRLGRRYTSAVLCAAVTY